MSLRTLFLLMGLVTALMIAGVIYTKVIAPPSPGDLSVGEMRSVDRMCDNECGTRAKSIAMRSDGSEELERRARACVAECKERILSGWRR